VATTSKGTVFVDIATTSQTTGSGGVIYELDLTTLIATPRNDVPLVQVAGEPLSQSADGSEVFLTIPGESGGQVMVWSAASDSWQTHLASGLFLNDVAAARDGNVFAANNDASISDDAFPLFFDDQPNQISQMAIEDILAITDNPVMALHDSGALLYSSTNLGVDIMDVRHGALAERILLNEQAAGISGSLAVDHSGGNIFLITNAGLTIIKLDAVPLSIGSVTPAFGSASTTIQLRGSGFQSGTVVKMNGTTAATQFIDTDTLQITVPAMPSGPTSITLSNPDGTSYKLDAAFIVQ
jgi:hypothetical protein